MGRAPGCSLLVALGVLCAACGASSRPSSHVAFEGFSLAPSGVVFELHPTDRPILISASAKPALEVCPVGTSFGSAWRRGCFGLGERSRALPRTSGAIHVLFRVRPRRGAISDVRRLELRWHCVDHRFGLRRLGSRMPQSAATFDC